MLTNAFTIPDDVTRLTQTFDGSKCIRGVTLGKSVRQIGNFSNSESAFTDNRALEFVDMSATTNLTDIGQLNFSSCQALRELTIPNTVTNIGREAFVNCTSLTNLVLPAGLQKIGPRAFKNVAKNTGLLCDIWWSGTPDAPPAGIGTSDSVMGYDEGANYRITHHFWIEDEDERARNQRYRILNFLAFRNNARSKDTNFLGLIRDSISGPVVGIHPVGLIVFCTTNERSRAVGYLLCILLHQVLEGIDYHRLTICRQTLHSGAVDTEYHHTCAHLVLTLQTYLQVVAGTVVYQS